MAQPEVTKKMSPMLQAFIGQSDLDEEKTKLQETVLSEWQDDQYKKALAQIRESGDIFQSALMNDDSSGPHDKSEIHPQFKDYDHSLEMDRVAKCKIKDGKLMLDDHGMEMRPVEKDGKIEYESTLTIEELLERA